MRFIVEKNLQTEHIIITAEYEKQFKHFVEIGMPIEVAQKLVKALQMVLNKRGKPIASVEVK